MTLVLSVLLAMTSPELSAQTVTGVFPTDVAGLQAQQRAARQLPAELLRPADRMARPSAAGPLNLLVFATTAAARETVELTSRIDSQVDLILSSAMGGFDTWWRTTAGRGGRILRRRPLQAGAQRPHSGVSQPSVPARRDPHRPTDVDDHPGELPAADPGQGQGRRGARLCDALAGGGAAPGRRCRWTADTPLAETIRRTVPLAVLPLEVKLDPPLGRGEGEDDGTVRSRGPAAWAKAAWCSSNTTTSITTRC